MIRTYQICTRCVMDTSDLMITFNEEGICNHCENFITTRSKYNYLGAESDQQLDQIIADIKISGQGKEYDCVIGVSGGVDSSYVAYLAKERGLRILAVHLDNGWNSEEANNNIKNICRKLEIDYVAHVLDWHEFKQIQLAFLKASVPEADTPTDLAIIGALHQVASKYKVKYIISGGNFATEGILPPSWHYNAKDTRYFNHIVKKMNRFSYSKFPIFGYKQEMYYKLVKGMKIIYYLNYVPYDKDKVIPFLEEKLEWKYYGGKHYESVYTGFIQSYYLNRKFQIDYRRALYATQICTGDIDRETAIEKLKAPSFSVEKVRKEKMYIAKKLGISLDEFEALCALPPKYYWDYPNDSKRLDFIYNTYRKLFKKEKLASF